MNTILVVEDDLDIRELERYTLESNGYAVLQAEHGKQALEVLSSESVDLIILDMMMPVMDGLSLIKTLRFVMNDTTPIIVVSAKGDESDIITALAHAAAGICMYGRGLTIGDDRQPCSEWADQLVHVTTDDDGTWELCLCREHRQQLEALAAEGGEAA